MSPEPAAPGPRKVPQAALIGGGTLLVVGICLIALAVLRSVGGSSTGEATIKLTTASDPTATGSTGAPLVIVTAEPTAKPTKKPRSAIPAPSTPAPKPTTAKPKAKKAPARAKPGANQTYMLRNVVTGRCVGPVEHAAVMIQDVCASGNQVRVEPTRAVGGIQLYRLRDTGVANQCLDVPQGESQAPGTKVSAFDCLNPSTSDNQEWQLKDSGKTSKGRAVFTVINYKSGNCLDVGGWAADKSDRAAGINLTIFTCSSTDWGFDDHYWTFD